MRKLARSLRERIDNIITYCTHGITNAVAEGINSKIMSIKRRAGGYRNILTSKRLCCSTAVDWISTHDKAEWTLLIDIIRCLDEFRSFW